MFEMITGLIIFVAVTMFLWKYTSWLIVVVFTFIFAPFMDSNTSVGCSGCMAGIYLLPCAYAGYIFALEAVARLFQ